MRRVLIGLAAGGVAAGLLGGCSFEHRTMLTNTAYEGRYTDGDFAEREATFALHRLAASLRDAGFSVTRRSAEQVLVDQDFHVATGRWVTLSETEVEDPETGETVTNVERRFEADGGTVRITLTGDIVVESGRNGRVRGVRYRVWPESSRVMLPIDGARADESSTPYGVFMDAVRVVVEELGTPLEEGAKEGTTNRG